MQLKFTCWVVIILASSSSTFTAPAAKKCKCDEMELPSSEKMCLLKHAVDVLLKVVENQEEGEPICIKNIQCQTVSPPCSKEEKSAIAPDALKSEFVALPSTDDQIVSDNEDRSTMVPDSPSNEDTSQIDTDSSRSNDMGGSDNEDNSTMGPDSRSNEDTSLLNTDSTGNNDMIQSDNGDSSTMGPDSRSNEDISLVDTDNSDNEDSNTASPESEKPLLEEARLEPNSESDTDDVSSSTIDSQSETLLSEEDTINPSEDKSGAKELTDDGDDPNLGISQKSDGNHPLQSSNELPGSAESYCISSSQRSDLLALIKQLEKVTNMLKKKVET